MMLRQVLHTLKLLYLTVCNIVSCCCRKNIKSQNEEDQLQVEANVNQGEGHYKPDPDAVVVTLTRADIQLVPGQERHVNISFTDIYGNTSKTWELGSVESERHLAVEDDNSEQFYIRDVSAGLKRTLGKIQSLAINRKTSFPDNRLFLNLIRVERLKTGDTSPFPIHRWVPEGNPLHISVYDSSLPQDDRFYDQRRRELEEARAEYMFQEIYPGLPPQCAIIPDEEHFSTHHQVDFYGTQLVGYAAARLEDMTIQKPGFLADYEKFFNDLCFPMPEAFSNKWYLEDEYFGYQRLAGCNPLLVERCISIPHNLAVTGSAVEPFLEGLSLETALSEKKIFIVDYKIVEGISTNPELELAAPLVLFYLNSKKQLLPIAIQIQQIPSETNPVFLPSDSSFTWLMAKMWCNVADSNIHESKAHLGFTHLIVGTICVTTHRELSRSHPVFKLLAPHFLFLIRMNSLAMSTLLSEGGFIDSYMAMGREGAFHIIQKAYLPWRLDIDGNPHKDIERRGVGEDVLPYYPYRDHAIPLHWVIHQYVTDVITGVYTDDSLLLDSEVQSWYRLIGAPVTEGGAGIKGIPGDGRIAKMTDVIDIVTSCIFISSVQHAAVNFKQYTEYAFPANYPPCLHCVPPINKDELSESDIVAALPDVKATTSMMSMVHLLSLRDTNSLGYFDVQYAYDSNTLAALARFRSNLSKLVDDFDDLEKDDKYPYDILNPHYIPNAISI